MKSSVSLVLSSGGARGIAHIGVIEELERQGYEIKSIAGSSMGALVGGMYASGHLEVFKEWMCKLDKKAVFSLVDFTLNTTGLVKGNKVINELKKLVPDVNIEDLPVSYAAISTDIKNKEEIVFEKGSLYEAIRASISIPGVLTPHLIGEMVLIDGGVLNPLPLNRVKRNKNDILIAVDVSSRISSDTETNKTNSPKQEKDELSLYSFLHKMGFPFLPKTKEGSFNYYTVLSQSSSLMIQQITALTINICKPDILINIPMNSYGPFHFYKSAEIIKAGELAAKKGLLKFQNKKL